MKLRDFINQFILRGAARLAKDSSGEDLALFLRSVQPILTEHSLIRIGDDADGGYLIPDDLAGVNTCFSPGVAASSSFELELARRGIRCFMADYSVSGPPVTNPLFHFEKKFLGTHNDETFTTLSAWVERNAPSEKEMILQMDIEGAEYDVLLSSPLELLRRFRTVIIEFHGLETLAEKRGLELISLSFGKMLEGFDVVHAHVNNCTSIVEYKGFELPPVMEFTFHRKDRSRLRKPATCFPHPLDRPNLRSRPDRRLPGCWHGGH